MMLPYILNASLLVGASVAFYKILLRRETFYTVNRYVLLVCLAIAFVLPIVKMPQQFSLRKSDSVQLLPNHAQALTTNNIFRVPGGPVAKQTSLSHGNSVNNNQAAQTAPPIFSVAHLVDWLFWFYWFGVIIFAASFLFQVSVLIYRSRSGPMFWDGEFRIVEVSGDKAPCSFGNTIFINPEKYDWETYNQILLHEKVHIRQKHSFDILIAELVLIFQWFNPFAWLYRREIENNLEFLTDDQLMQQKKVDKRSYQLSLVKVSAPHFPLSLTTNYNQSILKKRIAMMNSKRSNLHTAWKYFFLMPVFAFFACLLNEPTAKSQTHQSNHVRNLGKHDIETEGSWFGTIKGDKISIEFRKDDDTDKDHDFNSNEFKLSELSPEPKDGQVSFKIVRDAGTVEFTGRFENNNGMGHYKFAADKAFGESLGSQIHEKLDDRDQLVFFFVNTKKDFVSMLKSEGYNDVTKDNVITLSALGVDQPYIHAIRNSGLKDLSLENLVTFKALGIDDKYIEEIRSAGYKNIGADQLVSFKAQGIDKDYIAKVRSIKGKDDKDESADAEDVVSFKAMGITEDYINSFKAIGYTDIPSNELVSFKAVGVTPDYIKEWRAAGYNDINAEELVGMRSQNITPEYLKGFADMGYKDIKPDNLTSFKALGITPEWIHGFESIGYKNIDMDALTGLKAQGITPEFIKSFEAVGFKDIPLDEIVSVKAVGVTPEYVKEMKAKGFNYDKLEKYVRLKTIDL